MEKARILRAAVFLMMGSLLVLPCIAEGAAVEDFESGIAGWQNHRKGDGEAMMSHASEEFYAGSRSLRVDTPGILRLEGVCKTFQVTPQHRYNVSVMAKGQGCVMLCLYTPRGWIYGKHTDLSDKWQKLEISVYARTAGISPNIITEKKAQKVTFYLDELAIEREPLADLPASEIRGLKFEAEDYSGNANTVKDDSASGGAYREGAIWYELADRIPFPQTAIPVYAYLKAWAGDHEKSGLTMLYSGPGREPLYAVRLSASNQWEWVKAGPFAGGEIPGTFGVTHTGTPGKTARLDCIVFSTDAALDASALDSLSARRRSGRGLVAAGRAEQAPVIDGRLDDAAWRNAVEIGPFLRSGELEFAQEATRAYISYDDRNLYVAFRNEQGVLDPASNMLHAFKNQTKENDSDSIFKDDFVVILLNPDGKSTYDLFINASGAVNDARGTGENPWDNRDKGWNSGVQVKTGIHDGYWVAEAAIPFASLGAAPSSGNVWRVDLGRRSQHKVETSVWHCTAAGFHHPSEFGELVFAMQPVGIRDMHPGELNSGTNMLSARVEAAQDKKTSVRIQSVITGTDGKSEESYTDYAVTGNGALKHSYSIEAEGEIRFQYAIMNGADFGMYYRSPVYRKMAQSSSLEAVNTKGAGYRMYLNGRELKKQGALYKGVNIIAIETEGEFSGEFSVGNYGFTTAGGWRYSGTAGAGWNTAGYDDGGWQATESVSGVIGKQGEKGYYRRTLLFGHSMFWPNWDEQGIWMAGGTLQQLFLVPQGVQGMPLRGYSLVLEVPAEFSVAGASGYYKRMTVTVEDGRPVKRGGRDYRAYRIGIGEPVSYKSDIPSWQFCSVAVSLPAGRMPPGTDTVFYYRAEADNGAVTEIPQVLKVNILPAVNGKQPKKYLWQLWNGWLSNMDDKDLNARILESLPAYGFNEAGHHTPLPEGIPLRSFSLLTFDTWNLDMRPYLEKNPDHALLSSEGEMMYIPGNARKNHVCTTRLLEDGKTWDFVKTAVRGFIDRTKNGHINWDYEARVWNSYISCYCPLCMERFAKYAGLPAGTKLDPAVIREKYGEQWTDFMCRRMADLAGKFNGAVKEINPGIIFSVYSGYQSPETRMHYGVDWRYLAGRIDFAMCGYGRSAKELADTLDALGNTPLVVGELLYPYLHTERRYPTYASTAILLRRAIDGTGGVLVYELSTLDGRTFYASGEISRLVADFEPVFLAKNRRDELAEVSGMSREDLAVLVLGGTRMVMLINESGTMRNVRITNREFNDGMKVTDYYENKVISGGREIQTQVPARGVRVFIISQ